MRLYGPLTMHLSPQRQRKSAEGVFKQSPRARAMPRRHAIVGTLAAEWFVPVDTSHEGVIYYLHGGGYVVGSVRTQQNLIADLAHAAGCRAFAIDYRLAPEHPFPSAIADSVSGYRHLLAEGIAPERIVIGGDSAGGGLTIATLLKLRELNLPRPAAAFAISPWVDLELTGASLSKHAKYDYLTKAFLDAWARWVVGNGNRRDPLASPIHADLSGLPPLLIQAGGAEGLLDDSVRLAGLARRAGVSVQFDVYPDMIHIWHIFPTLVPEAQQAIASIGRFVQRSVKSEGTISVVAEEE